MQLLEVYCALAVSIDHVEELVHRPRGHGGGACDGVGAVRLGGGRGGGRRGGRGGGRGGERRLLG
jgi:hypothetical protein